MSAKSYLADDARNVSARISVFDSQDDDMSVPLFPLLVGSFPVDTVINDLFAIVLDQNKPRGLSATAASKSSSQLGIVCVYVMDKGDATKHSIFQPEVATIASLKAGFLKHIVYWEIKFIVDGLTRRASTATLSVPQSTAVSSAGASSAPAESAALAAVSSSSSAPTRAAARRLPSPAAIGARAASAPIPPMVSAGISALAPTIADAIWPRTLALDELVWVLTSLKNKAVTKENTLFWAPARITALPFYPDLPIKHTFNKVCVQVLVWAPGWMTWTLEMEPTSHLIRTWDQISEAQALAALPLKLQHLASNLTKGIAFARKWKTQVEREEKRGRVELRAGMEVGFNLPGQRSKGEV
jgi:hypothetical protein